MQNGAEIWVNGEPVSVSEASWGRDNYHGSGWTAWQADTPVARFGEKNLLAIRATKNTRSASLDSGDYFFLGGVYRPVTLFSVPRTHISDLTITTHLLPGDRAQVRVAVDVAGPDCPTVQMKLEGQEPLEVEAWNGKAWFSQIVSKPKLWSAESPNLYNLDITLNDAKGREAEKITRRVGIREITIKDGVLLVNGRIVKTAGICRHDLSADEGCAVGEDLKSFDADIVSSDSWYVPDDPAPSAEQMETANPPKLGENVGRIHVEFANGQFSYKIKWTGPKSDVQELGWVFNMPDRFDRFSWDREAPYTYYPDTHIGRARGVALPEANGHGLRLEFGARDRHHVRAGAGGGHQLVVNKLCCPPRDFSTNCVPDLYREMDPGDIIEGSFKVGSNKQV